jgi:cytochrome oxidase Cu insertion factor (SCO1/SenC/PrrC family)
MLNTKRRRTRILLVATFLTFLLPVVGAWLLNVFAPDWRPFGTLNHGILVQPVRAMGTSGLRHLDGTHFDPAYLTGRWTLVHLPDADCGEFCMDSLVRSHQIQQALGDDQDRVQLLLVVKQAADAPAAKLPAGTAVSLADDPWLAKFYFPGPDQQPPVRIYLVDPQGYLMMRYAGDVDQRGLLADLKRLLKISKIG